MTYSYTRGPRVVRWLYGVWRQLLTFVDLLGADKRPSATKLMAFITTVAVLLTALWRAKSNAAEVWTWPMFWTLFLCFAVMFGRWGLSMFGDVLKSKWSGGLGS